MRPSSGEALSASEPSGWMVRSMDSASGRRLVVSATKAEKARQLADQARRGRLQQRLPGGHVVGQAGDGLQFVGFERRAGNLRLGGVLRGIEEAADGNGNLLFEQQAKLAGELVLAGDPGFVGRGLEVENRVAADGRGGKAGDQSQQRLPLESGKVGVFNRRRNGIEQRHFVSHAAAILEGDFPAALEELEAALSSFEIPSLKSSVPAEEKQKARSECVMP
jgi:hypothetical protein